MSQRITIVGAGLVGSVLGVMLAKRGHRVRIIERRPDMRTASISAGRSINLAMSDRGLKTLELAGIDQDILQVAIPMYGRVMHDVAGNQTYQPYGVGTQAINSVSRGELNKVLLTVAERHGVEILFSRRCADVDLATASATFEHGETGEHETFEADVLFGADGAYSAVRQRMTMTDRFDYSQTYLPHSYKELHIPPSADGGFQLEKHALHIWPRHSYMMIALPNLDGSFTCTLFFAHKGSPSFDELKTREDVERFFNEQFPDAVALMPTLIDDYHTNPESSLVTVRCYPWVANNKVALIGDAAHAIVPFYGQGMNCGFEDCRILMACLDHCNEDWTSALALYQDLRKPNGDAIAQLALDNFIEMRDKVADPVFLLRKSIEGYLHATYPDKFVPLYTLVTFSPDVAYSEALRSGLEADALLAEIMAMPDVATSWNTDAGKRHIDAIMQRRQPVAFASGMPA
ncbi:MAG: FAD-dependent monooxygenase [Candidatus Kapabacteria bacterium]|nr:FAD-dependent monooxygenase [Candidatus Kapabacteria bacterium]